ncbi:hypothetical protein ALC57_13972, partial [Trachymyrmex cornetzi]
PFHSRKEPQRKRKKTEEEDFVAKMYFTDDIDGSIELDWCLQWKREILGWNDGMAVERVGLYGGGKRNHLLHLEPRSPIRMHSLIFYSTLFYHS